MDGIDWAASAMGAARIRLEVATQNLANSSSDAFAERVASVRASSRGLVVSTAASREHGPLRYTGRAFDFAVVGDGAFRVRSGAARPRYEFSRDGAFSQTDDGRLIDLRGRELVGSDGRVVRVTPNTTLREDGTLTDGDRIVARLALPNGATVRAGFLESSGADGVTQMIAVLETQRTFESNEKALSAIDQTRQKAANDIVRVN